MLRDASRVSQWKPRKGKDVEGARKDFIDAFMASKLYQYLSF
jgi:hypothetical protein